MPNSRDFTELVTLSLYARRPGFCFNEAKEYGPMMRSALVVAAVVLAAPLYAQQPYAPARYAAGSGPILPVQVVGGGQAFVELTARFRR